MIFYVNVDIHFHQHLLKLMVLIGGVHIVLVINYVIMKIVSSVLLNHLQVTNKQKIGVQQIKNHHVKFFLILVIVFILIAKKVIYFQQYLIILLMVVGVIFAERQQKRNYSSICDHYILIRNLGKHMNGVKILRIYHLTCISPNLI